MGCETQLDVEETAQMVKEDEVRRQVVHVGGDIYRVRGSAPGVGVSAGVDEMQIDTHADQQQKVGIMAGMMSPKKVEPEDSWTPLLKIETEYDFTKNFVEKDVEGAKWCANKPCCDCSGGWDLVWKNTKSNLPVLQWGPRYPLGEIFRDLMIGATLAFVIAPKAMAHALLAELPPIHGIYTVLFSTLVYGLMGEQKWLSVGTAALPALLFGEALKSLSGPATEYESVTGMLAFFIGMWTLVMMVLRLDKLVVFIPPPVLSAFTTVAAFLIGTSQVKYVLGLKISSDGFVQTWVQVFQNFGKISWATFIFSVLCMLYLYASKKITLRYLKKFRIPDTGPIVVVLVSVLLVYLGRIDEKFHIQVVGETPAGMPPFHLPWDRLPDTSLISSMLVKALIIALINFILTIAIAKGFALKSKSVVRVPQEMKALGGANIIGSFFGSMVAGGSFSGSAIIASLEAETLLHNFVNSFVMMIILVALTPMVELLPKATLASIIIVALPSLVNFKVPRDLYGVKLDDFLLWVGTFIITLFAGVEYGIAGGAALSLIALIYRNVGSELTELGALPGTTIYRSLDRFPDAIKFEGIKMFRLDASLSFANFENFEVKLHQAIAGHLEHTKKERKPTDGAKTIPQQNEIASNDQPSMLEIRDAEAPAEPDTPPSPPPNTNSKKQRLTIIISCEAVNDIDTSGITMLCAFAKKCHENDIELLFSGWKCGPRQTLYSAHAQFLKENGIKQTTTDLEGAENTVIIPAPLDPNCWFLNLHDAVVRARNNFENISGVDSISSTSATSSSSDLDIQEQQPDEDVHWPKLQIKQSNKNRTNSSPVTTTTTTEVTPSGATHSWNYARKFATKDDKQDHEQEQ